MSDQFELNAEVRNDVGKGASRRLRRLGDKVPAIIYGGDKDPQNIALDHDDLVHHLENEAFFSHIITLNMGKSSEQVILRDLQRHPAKPKILHADFQRVTAKEKLHTKVPLHFINEEKCKGVKLQGGTVNHNITELDIQCLPKDLPEFIEVDIEALEAGDILHISDLKLPKGVESVDLQQGGDHDLPVVTVNKPKTSAADDGEDEGEAGEEGGAE